MEPALAGGKQPAPLAVSSSAADGNAVVVNEIVVADSNLHGRARNPREIVVVVVVAAVAFVVAVAFVLAVSAIFFAFRGMEEDVDSIAPVAVFVGDAKEIRTHLHLAEHIAQTLC